MTKADLVFFHGQRSKSIKLCKQIKKVESVVKSVPFPIIEFYRSNCSFWVNWHRFCEIMTGRKTPSRHYHRHVSPYYSSVVFWVCALLKLGDQSNSSFSASQTVNCIVGTRMSTGYSISRWQAFTLSLLDWVHTKTHFKGTNLFHTFIPLFFDRLRYQYIMIRTFNELVQTAHFNLKLKALGTRSIWKIENYFDFSVTL